jgi:hypothetical protein
VAATRRPTLAARPRRARAGCSWRFPGRRNKRRRVGPCQPAASSYTIVNLYELEDSVAGRVRGIEGRSGRKHLGPRDLGVTTPGTHPARATLEVTVTASRKRPTPTRSIGIERSATSPRPSGIRGGGDADTAGAVRDAPAALGVVAGRGLVINSPRLRFYSHWSLRRTK